MYTIRQTQPFKIILIKIVIIIFIYIYKTLALLYQIKKKNDNITITRAAAASADIFIRRLCFWSFWLLNVVNLRHLKYHLGNNCKVFVCAPACWYACHARTKHFSLLVRRLPCQYPYIYIYILTLAIADVWCENENDLVRGLGYGCLVFGQLSTECVCVCVHWATSKTHCTHIAPHHHPKTHPTIHKRVEFCWCDDKTVQSWASSLFLSHSMHGYIVSTSHTHAQPTTLVSHHQACEMHLTTYGWIFQETLCVR